MHESSVQFDRYHRQRLLPQIGPSGQARLAASRVLLVGCGALGGHIADQIIRGGIGFLRLADRDIVDLTNLQRQPLFDERDIGQPKAAAAARRLAQINSTVTVEPIITDVWAGNIEHLIETIDLILDGTDNVQTRYLLNDASIKHDIPWIHGACVGTEGRVMPIVPGMGACLRCLFPQPPAAGELPTCDTAGVLQSAAATVASLQVAAAFKILTHQWMPEDQTLVKLDIWTGRFTAIDLQDARSDDCPCCGRAEYPFLETIGSDSASALCGRDAVQIRPSQPWNDADFHRALDRLGRVGTLEVGDYFSRCRLTETPELVLTCFRDGRMLVHGTTDTGRARAICARYIGA
jgi:molybdopterin-synthase adenylyltransferase